MKKLLLLGIVGFAVAAPPALCQPILVRGVHSNRTWPRLSRRDEGDYRVEYIQLLLRQRGYSWLKADGGFGAQTEKAAKAFQKSRGLKADGIVGPQTFEKLVVGVKKGDRGEAVRALQSFFGYSASESGDASYRVDADGLFGLHLDRAVRKFQRESHLPIDGVVGVETWCLLFEGRVTRK